MSHEAFFESVPDIMKYRVYVCLLSAALGRSKAVFVILCGFRGLTQPPVWLSQIFNKAAHIK
jgi:hypothetical protein